MGAYLRTMKSFGVDVKGARDEVMDDGQKIMIAGTVNYLVRSPDRFRAEINTDRKQRTIYYNGKTMTLYAPRMHYYATGRRAADRDADAGHGPREVWCRAPGRRPVPVGHADATA